MSQPTPTPPPNEGRVLGLINAAKGLTLFNVLVVALLVLILIPVYIVYRALSDEALLDRFLSSYRELPSDTGCSIRVVAERGGPERWSISSGFAASGNDRYVLSVILQKEPTKEETVSYCESIKLIAGLLDHSGGDDAPALGH
jgi:hypothetical protein